MTGDASQAALPALEKGLIDLAERVLCCEDMVRRARERRASNKAAADGGAGSDAGASSAPINAKLRRKTEVRAHSDAFPCGKHPYHINPLQMTVLEAYQVLIVLAQYVNTDPFTSASDKTTLFLSALVRAGVPKKS